MLVTCCPEPVDLGLLPAMPLLFVHLFSSKSSSLLYVWNEGLTGGTGLSVERIELGVFGEFRWDTAAAQALGDFGFEGALRGGKLKITMDGADGFIGDILSGISVEADFELGIGWSASQGMYFTGSSTLEIQLPTHISLGPVELDALTLRVGIDGQSFPIGLANSSDHLGHFVMDHIYATGVSGALPDMGRKPENATRPNGIYIPRFRNLFGDKQQGFIRGYGYQGGEGNTSFEHAYSTKGFGKSFKEEVREGHASRFSLSGFGEMLPRWDNRAYIDPEVTDAWGIPVIRVECELGDNEKAMVKDIVEQGQEMLEAAGVKNISLRTTPAPPGFGIHEVGTARMGEDPKTSVLNKWNQAHDVKNLFVMDGSCFVSIACQNPTLTMMALTVRACEYLIDEHKRGNLA